jgi:hypothetical protein
MGLLKVKVVRNEYGQIKPVCGTRVCVGYHGLAGGITNYEYTSSSGHVSWDAGNRCTGFDVYVNGTKYGPFSCYYGADVTVNVR